MHGRSAIWFLLAVLALLASLTLWIEHVVQPPVPKPDGSSRHDPDYILNNFSTLKTDKNGNLRHGLAAEEMRHFPDDDSTLLKRPRFTQFAADKPVTKIEGERGHVTSDGKNVYFMDNVKVVRGATRQKGELTVLTDYLHIIPDEDIAKTDRPVTILQAPKTVIHGTGMLYNKKQGTLQLYSKVRVHYEKPASKRPAPSASSTKAKNPSASKPKDGKSTARVTPAATAKTGTNQIRLRRLYDNRASQP